MTNAVNMRHKGCTARGCCPIWTNGLHWLGLVAQAAAEDSDALRRAEREALIQELRDSVCELADALQCGSRACYSPCPGVRSCIRSHKCPETGLMDAIS